MNPQLAGARASSDEHYVLDLCDEILEQRAERQHCFGWLVGDPGRDGRCRHLLVDAFYPVLGIVIEYRETQHERPGPRHWNKPTISGLPRDAQRRRYDERRDAAIPAHELRLIVITPRQLAATKAGRLRRDRPADLETLRSILG